MKALCWHGKNDVRIDQIPDPKLIEPRDAIVKVTATAICGSDLHLLDGYASFLEDGDILGHEFMGEVIEVGSGNKKLKVGDRVVVPFTISCGSCFFCNKGLYSLCDESNPKADLCRQNLGQATAGLFGYTHMMGGFPGGQAEYVRVPFADVGPIKVPEGLKDEQVLFLSDIYPTGYMAAENCDIEPGDTVAIWGCGPVAQFAIKSAWMFGAGRVIAIDYVPERLEMARDRGNAETINFKKEKVYDRLMEMTKGRGPDRCIEAVGAEAHGGFVAHAVDSVKAAMHLGGDQPYALNEAIMCCRKGGTISVPGVYLGSDKLIFGVAMNKAITFKMGQTHVQRYSENLLGKIQSGEIDPSFVITHRLKLDDAPEAYKTFRDKKDGCIKVMMTP